MFNIVFSSRFDACKKPFSGSPENRTQRDGLIRAIWTTSPRLPSFNRDGRIRTDVVVLPRHVGRLYPTSRFSLALQHHLSAHAERKWRESHFYRLSYEPKFIEWVGLFDRQ